MEIMINPMPDSCDYCPCNDDDYRCGATGTTFDYGVSHKERMSDCPLKRTGEWIDEHYGWWRCSECGESPLEEQEVQYRSKYCPHCGALMRNTADDRTEKGAEKKMKCEHELPSSQWVMEGYEEPKEKTLEEAFGSMDITIEFSTERLIEIASAALQDAPCEGCDIMEEESKAGVVMQYGSCYECRTQAAIEIAERLRNSVRLGKAYFVDDYYTDFSRTKDNENVFSIYKKEDK